MNKKLRTAFIIVSVFVIGLLTLLLTASIGGISLLNDYKYLISNGQEVDGRIVNYHKGYTHGTYDKRYRYHFKLFYEFEEDDRVWKTSESWFIREDKVKEVEEREAWCKERIGESVKLIIDDKGHCLVADKAQSIYKEQYNFVYLRGGILLAGDVAFVIILIICIFYKPKNRLKSRSNI